MVAIGAGFEEAVAAVETDGAIGFEDVKADFGAFAVGADGEVAQQARTEAEALYVRREENIDEGPGRGARVDDQAAAILALILDDRRRGGFKFAGEVVALALELIVEEGGFHRGGPRHQHVQRQQCETGNGQNDRAV